jgi:hypothetical protein
MSFTLQLIVGVTESFSEDRKLTKQAPASQIHTIIENLIFFIRPYRCSMKITSTVYSQLSSLGLIKEHFYVHLQTYGALIMFSQSTHLSDRTNHLVNHWMDFHKNVFKNLSDHLNFHLD